MRPDGAVHTVHPALLRAFAALDGAGVAWCLLRGEARLADPSGDVDLLVAPADLPRLDAVLATAGFLPVPGVGKGAHRGYVGATPRATASSSWTSSRRWSSGPRPTSR